MRVTTQTIVGTGVNVSTIQCTYLRYRLEMHVGIDDMFALSSGL